VTCSDATAAIRTEDLQASITMDTSVLGGLGLGTESQMLLASRGDTLDTRVIIRFDSLPRTTQTSAASTATVPIDYVNAASLLLHFDSSAAAVTFPVKLSLYDVDTPGNDTSVAVLAPLFTPSRLITSVTYLAGAIHDTVRVPLPSAFLLAKAQAHARLRIGLQLSASGSVQTRLFASSTTLPEQLTLRTSPDTAVHAVTLGPYSSMPADNSSIAGSLADFTLVVRGSTTPSAGVLAVGGLPARRVYLRFDLPPRIVDSSIVVRAALLLTQIPSQSPDASDTMFVLPSTVVAGAPITDPAKAAQIISSSIAAYAVFKTVPSAGGEKAVEVAPAFAIWAAQSDTTLPRALVLASSREDYSAQQALFYSSSAADPAVRPHLRISYTRRSRIGIP